jgi:hypothetical protein
MTNADIDDYTLAPQSVQAKVNDSHLLKVFQWLQDLRRLDGLSVTTRIVVITSVKRD